MKGIFFPALIRLLHWLSRLPFPVLYAISDFVYLVIYRVVGYRKKVVMENLRNSFPEKSEAEIRQIARAYYHYLCDLLLETFKTLSFSPEEAMKRCHFPDLTVFNQLYAERKSIIIVMGHYGNWEWAGSSMSLETPYQLFVIYHPLSNPYFDQLIYQMRTKFGTKLIAMNNTFREMVKNRDTISATAFIADQTPSATRAYWTRFLNQDTPVYEGPAIIAKRMNYPIVFANVQRVRRGYYEVHIELLVEDPRAYTEDQISEMHTRRLEQEIIRRPELWLWSHRRWKHKRPEAPEPIAEKK